MQKVPKGQVEGTKWKPEGTKGTIRRFKRVIRMYMYQSGKQKVTEGKSEGIKGAPKRFKTVNIMFQKGQPEGTKG